MTRSEALARLRGEIDAGRPVIGAGAGTGLSAKCAEAGGTDLIIIYNSGRYRMAGRGSLSGLLPYGDANAIVVDMASEVLPIVKETPVLAGVCGTDPFRLMDVFLDEVRRIGFSGVQNFPTVGLIGAPLLFAAFIAVLFGAIDQVSATAFFLTLPVAAWELSVGLWMTFKGFRPAAIAALDGHA